MSTTGDDSITAALRERVDNQGTAIRALADDTAQQFRDLRSDFAKSLSDIVGSVKGLDTKFDASQARLNEAQRPQYLGLFGAMIAAVGLSVTIIQWQTSLHDKPVDDKLLTLTQAIADLTKNTATAFGEAAKGVVSRQEYQQGVEFRDKLQAVMTAGRDQNRAQMQAQLDRLQTDIVSRRELDFHWAADEKDSAHQTAQIEALNRRMDELAPAGDMLRRLDGREHDLELHVYGKNGVP